MYDLYINVKKQYGVKEGYTYTIKVIDNKKISPFPTEDSIEPLKVLATDLSREKVPHTESSVKRDSTLIEDSYGRKLSTAQYENKKP